RAFTRAGPEALAVERRRGRGHHRAIAGGAPRIVGPRVDAAAPARDHAHAGQAHAGHATTPSRTSAALQPPKPSDVLRLTRGRAERGRSGTESRSHSASPLSKRSEGRRAGEEGGAG